VSTKNDEKETTKKTKGEKSLTDRWREAERAAKQAEDDAEMARQKANDLGSELAQQLIEKHKGAMVELDGVKYAPKAGATRSMKDGTTKAPKWPYQLARTKDKGIVEV
jgi:hypothetical protein